MFPVLLQPFFILSWALFLRHLDNKETKRGRFNEKGILGGDEDLVKKLGQIEKKLIEKRWKKYLKISYYECLSLGFFLFFDKLRPRES